MSYAHTHTPRKSIIMQTGDLEAEKGLRDIGLLRFVN